MLGAEDPLSVCRANPLNLQLAPENSNFPSSSRSAFLLDLREGARMELQTPGPSSLRAFGSLYQPTHRSFQCFKIPAPPCCRNTRSQLYVTSLSVLILAQKGFLFVLFVLFLIVLFLA